MEQEAGRNEFGSTPLRRGWTTGACATAAAKAAFHALLTGTFPDPVEIPLPGGRRAVFALASEELRGDVARAGIVKDAGDDPDVTHGALVVADVRPGPPGTGIIFRAGAGVGTITRPGLPLPPGEPAINPVPRAMMREALGELAAAHGLSADLVVEISVPGGDRLAARTLNPRLGIVGGISILGTTGIVIPYSCSAWIHSVHRGIDVARAAGLLHVAGSTGSTSEAATRRLHDLPETALVEMGDFVGPMLKYLRRHPVPRVTVAGGFAKMTKLGQGLLDLHSGRGAVDLGWLGQLAGSAGDPALGQGIARANTAAHALELARERNFPLGAIVAEAAWRTAAALVAGSGIRLDVAVFDRDGMLVGHHDPGGEFPTPPLNLRR